MPDSEEFFAVLEGLVVFDNVVPIELLPLLDGVGAAVAPTARLTPLDMEEVLTQLDDFGVVYAPVGVVRSPMVYAPPLGSMPV